MSNTTRVTNGGSTVTVTQSGDGGDAEVHIVQTPGRTTVYRRSGGNTATTVQVDGGGIVEERDWAELAGRDEAAAAAGPDRPDAAASGRRAKAQAAHDLRARSAAASARFDRAFADIRRRPGFADGRMDKMLEEMQAQIDDVIDRALPRDEK
jgi:hypothetical protein